MFSAVRRLGCIQRHLLPTSRRLPMVQQAMSAATRAGATNEESLHFLETIFSTPDLGVLALESKCRRFCDHYTSLAPEDRLRFLTTLSKQYGVNQEAVVQVARSVVSAQEKGEALLLMTEERLRHTLIPQYQQLFSKIGRLEGGVKFLVDMRADILTHLPGVQSEEYKAHMRILQQTIRDLLALWFSVGFLHLQRITWQSPCDMVQKISQYEAVHPIRDMTDLKRRVGSYRRCFVFTHGSMPGEPVVVLHTALTGSISSSIHSILKTPTFSGRRPETDSSSDGDVEEKEELSKISAAIFYSITSTQKVLGLFAVLGVARPGEICQKMSSTLRCASVGTVLRVEDAEVKEIRIFRLSTGGRVIAPFAETVEIEDTPDPAAACLSVLTEGRVVVRRRECSPRKTPSTTDRSSGFVWSRTSTQATTPSTTPKVTLEAAVLGIVLGGMFLAVVIAFVMREIQQPIVPPQPENEIQQPIVPPQPENPQPVKNPEPIRRSTRNRRPVNRLML